ncbi:phosphatase PAP2 family protein [Lyticum sinuosum]|uniref:phosphatase PAP2 family protein n=1 Tax=Lyticum sinuosum TaxID=1332059 RepID=UPI002ACE7D09|nr:phosphatase PAP2 family protein [Lyticum sinuosum]
MVIFNNFNNEYSLFDKEFFIFFNNLLNKSIIIKIIVAVLNHPYEKFLGIAIMLSFNIWGILSQPKENRKKAFLIFIYFWISLEISIILNNRIFHKKLRIMRDSPTLVLEGVKLSEIFPNYGIKDRAIDSFPSGHAFVIIFFALFQTKILGRCHIATVFITVFWCLPRIIVGAHWFSDVAFGGTMGWFFYENSIILLNMIIFIKEYFSKKLKTKKTRK